MNVRAAKMLRWLLAKRPRTERGHSTRWMVSLACLVAAGLLPFVAGFGIADAYGGPDPETAISAPTVPRLIPLTPQSVGSATLERYELSGLAVGVEQLLCIAAIVLALTALLVWLSTRRILRPIRELTAAAKMLADGQLEEKVRLQGSGEMAELGHALELVRCRFQRAVGETEERNHELKQQLLERSKQLDCSRDELERSRESMQLLIDRLSALNGIALALNRSLELETVLQEALAHTLRLTSMRSGAIYLMDEQTGELELAAYKGISREAACVAANLGLSASLCAAAAQAGEPLVVENTARYARGKRSLLVAEEMRCMVRVPFKSDGRLLGTVCLGCPEPRSFSKPEMELLASAGNQIAVAVEKARLYEELQRKEKLRGDLLQKVISAQEDERRRIARELHDETSQALAALALAVETAAGQAAEGDDVSASLVRMKSLAVSTLEEVHRLIFDLRPTLLDDLGLIAAIRWYTETRLGDAGIKVRIEIAGEERRLAPLIETTLYRVVQEAVNNAANHSGAQSVTISLAMRPRCLTLAMIDNGWGFDMAELASCSDGARGLGLMGMQERVELLGGTFSIHSSPGQGTEIALEVPLDKEGGCDS
jgi:signal transduction histidine kinase